MDGRAMAPGAGTILNALANEKGSAFAIDVYTTATVVLEADGPITGEIAEDPEADTALVERCLELMIDRFGDEEGGHIRTESDVPMAAGLKSSSAAANATILAACSALGITVDDDPETAGITRIEAARLGVEAARDVGVTVTGAFDDASASMLGGVTVTDNRRDELLDRSEVEWDVLVWTPPDRAFSADAAVERCQRLAPIADFILETALTGQFAAAMSVNGFAFCAALGFPPDPLLEALPEASGVSLSGTGPSVTAIGEPTGLAAIEDRWSKRDGTTWRTTTQTKGARIH